MKYQRILCEVLSDELQKAMWTYEIYLLLVIWYLWAEERFFHFLLAIIVYSVRVLAQRSLRNSVLMSFSDECQDT